ELLFGKLANRGSQTNRTGFSGGIIVGASLGLLWTPCVGPILAGIISLALSEAVTGAAVIIIIAYALGTAIPMFIIMQGGRKLLKKVPWLMKNTGRIQKIFGVLMIVTAVAIVFNLDRKFQTYIIGVFPNYGIGLTSLEDNDAVREQLDKLNAVDDNSKIGAPMFDASDSSVPLAPELIQGGEWLNSEPLTLESLRGEKVVLIDFWTYSCINCIRTQPYLNDWYSKYRDQGLEIIGVHSPEFEFEKKADNVARAIADAGILYPVMQDNAFKTWRAYKNRYWPRKYLIDHTGKIIYDHIGEGDYDETEKEIQKALEALSNAEINTKLSDIEDNFPKSGFLQPITPELYFGSQRNTQLANGVPGLTGASNFTVPDDLVLNKLYLGGSWDITGEYAESEEGRVSINLDYQATVIYIVLSSDTGPITVTILNNGESVGTLTVEEEKLYTVLELDEYAGGSLEINADQPGLRAYAFTFG
ncbi:redoxin domain-containing protein, partial [Patescibacteria group bacterium]|nr:redoxin domain-containing protein [Patescibacteria group bacterium]